MRIGDVHPPMREVDSWMVAYLPDHGPSPVCQLRLRLYARTESMSPSAEDCDKLLEPYFFRQSRVAVSPENHHQENITLRLHHRLPFQSEALMRFLARRSIPGVEEIVDGHYRRAAVFGGSVGLVDLDLSEDPDHVIMRLQIDDLHDVDLAVQRCRRLLDLEADPATIAQVLGTDPMLAPLLGARPGLRVPGAVDGWEIAVRAILGQQVSVAAARTMAGRMVAVFGQQIPAPESDLTHLFPPPEAVVEADLASLGLTGIKVEAIRGVARAIIHKELKLDHGADRKHVAERLQRLPGIGPWTVSYIAMRALGDSDAFPVSDLGIRQAFARLGLETNARYVEHRAERWRPWRAYAAVHLWESLS
jgi:AraC family transcriptional regulator of adaptative response / DNA-3-methyladenine glycosylase II